MTRNNYTKQKDHTDEANKHTHLKLRSRLCSMSISQALTPTMSVAHCLALLGQEGGGLAGQESLLRQAAGQVDAIATEKVLLGHAANVHAILVEVPVPGDGDCLFHATALQAPRHAKARDGLRKHVVKDVRDHKGEYELLMGNNQPLGDWTTGMAKGEWGDHVAVLALANRLHRPMIIWRRNSTLPPTVVPPRDFFGLAVQPIYLMLDETTPNAPHYTALVPPAHLPPPVVQPPQCSEVALAGPLYPSHSRASCGNKNFKDNAHKNGKIDRGDAGCKDVKVKARCGQAGGEEHLHDGFAVEVAGPKGDGTQGAGKRVRQGQNRKLERQTRPRWKLNALSTYV